MKLEVAIILHMENNKRETAFRHFSHNHSLVFSQIGTNEIHCFGCKSAGSGNVYVCRQCSYFLHEHCFHAARSLNHGSHPLHPLTLLPSPTYPSGSFFCNSCSLSGDGFSYSCSECEFDIHVHCALNIPTPNPRPYLSPVVNPTLHFNAFHPITQTSSYPTNPNNQYPNFTPPNTTPPVQPLQNGPPAIIKHFSHPHVLKDMEIEQNEGKICSACECKLSGGAAYDCTESRCSFGLHKACFDTAREVCHKSHPEHLLTLLATPPYSGGFTCNACLKEGKGFAYSCGECSYDLHVECVRWPEKMTSADHKHALTLYYSAWAAAAVAADQQANFTCDVCEDPVHECEWVYHCRECDYATHLECVNSAVKQQNVGTTVYNHLLDEETRKSILDLWKDKKKKKKYIYWA
ncbi:hypothetical protein ABFS83_02G127100 [Erythranthe nasuta]